MCQNNQSTDGTSVLVQIMNVSGVYASLPQMGCLFIDGFSGFSLFASVTAV